MMRRREWISCALAGVLAASLGAAPAFAGTQAAWGFGTLGSGVGLSGILTAQNGAVTEIYVGGSALTSFGSNTNWQALAYSPSTGLYEVRFVSETFPQGIRQLALWKVQGVAAPFIVVALTDGTLQLYDQTNKALLGSLNDPCFSNKSLAAFATADFNSDGTGELVSLCGDGRLNVYGSNYASWSINGLGNVFNGRIVVGQMDDDAALEVATTNGHVIDGVSHAIQWTRNGGFGAALQAADIDADGRDELFAAFSDAIWTYDVERQLPKWSIPLFDPDTILVTDVNGDGVRDLIVGDGQWGAVHAYNTATLQPQWTIANPEHGVAAIAVADVNGGGAKEILFGGGHSSSGSDHLYVVNWSSQAIVWQSEHLDGPFLGPEVGDLDGDGKAEIVVATVTSESGYDSGRIIVFDGQTLKVRGIFRGVAGVDFSATGIHDLKLRDLNKDGRMEIFVATDYLYDGLIEAYQFSAANVFTKVWANSVRPYGEAFHSVEVADLDGNGTIEVIGGSGKEHTGATGTYVHVYDAVSGSEVYKVPVQVSWEPLTALAIADFDGDGHLEVAALADGKGVYMFDGVSRGYDAIIEDTVTSLGKLSTGNLPIMLLGTSTGDVSARVFNGGLYGEMARVKVDTKRIDGVHVTPTGSLWVAAGGVLKRYSDTAGYFETANYGAPFGRSMPVFAVGVVFSAGDHGVHAFVTQP